MNEPTQELEGYFAGECTVEQLHTVEAWIHADPSNAQSFMAQCHFRELVGQYLRECGDQKSLAFAELVRLEDQAESLLVTLHDGRDWKPLSPSSQGWYNAGSYLLEKALTRIRLVPLAMTAVLLLTALLVVVLMNGTEPPQTPFASSLEQPTSEGSDVTSGTDLNSDSPPPPVVAALITEAGAVWDRRPNQGMSAAEQFSLREGFAQIDFMLGASVLIEGPCSFEIIDSNTIHVGRGRLVANIPPEARLFTVITPTAEVIDFGTEFSVDVLEGGDTEVGVFHGLVELHEQPQEDSADPPQHIELRTGQTAQVDSAKGLDANVKTFTPESQAVYVRDIEDAKRAEFLYARRVLRLEPIAYWSMMGQHPLNNMAVKPVGRELAPVGEEVLEREDGPPYFKNSQVIAIDGARSFYTAGPFEPGVWEDGAYSVSLWVRINTNGSDNILSFVPSVEERYLHYSNQIKVEASGQLQHYTYCPTELNPKLKRQAVVRSVSDQPVQTGRWIHLTATYGNGVSRLYVDGEIVAEEIARYVFETGYPTLLVGGATSLSRPNDIAGDFKGAICQLAIFNQVLTQQEVESLALSSRLDTN